MTHWGANPIHAARPRGLAIGTASAPATSRRRRRGEVFAPQVRQTPEPFVSGVRAALSSRTQALAYLALELYARRLSMRDIEDGFTEVRAEGFCRAGVSEITERLWAEYGVFSKRDRSEHAIAYL